MNKLEFENLDKIIAHGVVSYNRIKHGKNKIIKCPICKHKHLLEEDICPRCGYELVYTLDILCPHEPSVANGDLTPNEYKILYNMGCSPEKIRDFAYKKYRKQ